MITGHLGVAGVVRSASRERMSSLIFAALLLASLTPDIVDLLYWLARFCSPYGLYSHTLHAIVLEAAVVGGVALLITDSWRIALLFAIVVLLHAPADFITGRKLLVPGGEMVGLRLYDRPSLDWLVEIPLVVIGWWLLRRSGRAPRWATSIWVVLGLIVTQTTLDAAASRRGRGVKPNACPIIATPISP
ncbi:MAG: hypothetical protein ABJE10_23190 [bacterium]